jgi:hypothetical protein
MLFVRNWQVLMQVSGNKYEKELHLAPAFDFCFVVERWGLRSQVTWFRKLASRIMDG